MAGVCYGPNFLLKYLILQHGFSRVCQKGSLGDVNSYPKKYSVRCLRESIKVSTVGFTFASAKLAVTTLLKVIEPLFIVMMLV